MLNSVPLRATLLTVGFLFTFALGACRNPETATTAKAKVETQLGTKIEQSGSVEVPAQAASGSAGTSIPLPSGSKVTIFEPSETSPRRIEVILTAPSVLESKSLWEKVSLPKTFLPPAAPSALEQANADGVTLSYYLAGGLLLLTLGLAYTTHYKAAIVAGIGAVAAPIFARFVSEISALGIVAISLTGAVALYAAWYLLRRKTTPPSPTLQTSPENDLPHI